MVQADRCFQWRIANDSDCIENWLRTFAIHSLYSSNRMTYQMDYLIIICLICIDCTAMHRCMYRIQLDHGNVGSCNQSICCGANKYVSAMWHAMAGSSSMKSHHFSWYRLKWLKNRERVRMVVKRWFFLFIFFGWAVSNHPHIIYILCDDMLMSCSYIIPSNIKLLTGSPNGNLHIFIETVVAIRDTVMRHHCCFSINGTDFTRSILVAHFKCIRIQNGSRFQNSRFIEFFER